jgi:hypothetical protein
MNEVSIRFTDSAERIANQDNVAPGLMAQDKDTGHTFLRTTGGWKLQTPFLPADGLYDDDKLITDGTPVLEAIPVNAAGVKARTVYMRNKGPTNLLRIKFGDATVVANLTSGEELLVDTSDEIPVPQDDDITHMSRIAAVADVTVVTIWRF